MQTTISTSSGKFFRDLKAFARDTESNCRDLKTNLERVALCVSEGGNSAQVLVESIALQVDDLTNEVDQLVSCQGFNNATAHLSLEALYTQCLAVYDKNEELKEELETKLEQYSFQRKDPTKQKTTLQQPQPSKLPQPTKIPMKSSSQSNISKPSLPSTSTTKSALPNTSNALTASSSTLGPSSSSASVLNSSSSTQPVLSQPLPIPTESKQPETTSIHFALPIPHLSLFFLTTSEITPPSPPHTPPKSKTLFDDFPRTPTLDDFGISASALEVLAKDQVKKQKKVSLTKEPSNLPEGELNFTFTTLKVDEQAPIEKRVSNESSRSSTSSVEDGGNFISERRKTKTKKSKEKSTKAPATMFPLMEEIRQEEYNAISPEYLKHSFSLELNKAVSKINEHMTDKRFSMEEGVTEGAMESFTEADLRDDMEFGIKAKSIVLLLIQLKRIALDKRFGGTRLTILEKADK